MTAPAREPSRAGDAIAQLYPYNLARRVVLEPAAGDELAHRLRFPYSPELVELLKATIPAGGRWWDPARQLWWVSSLEAADAFLTEARRIGYTAQVVTRRPRFESGPDE